MRLVLQRRLGTCGKTSSAIVRPNRSWFSRRAPSTQSTCQAGFRIPALHSRSPYRKEPCRPPEEAPPPLMTGQPTVLLAIAKFKVLGILKHNFNRHAALRTESLLQLWHQHPANISRAVPATAAPASPNPRSEPWTQYYLCL